MSAVGGESFQNNWHHDKERKILYCLRFFSVLSSAFMCLDSQAGGYRSAPLISKSCPRARCVRTACCKLCNSF